MRDIVTEIWQSELDDWRRDNMDHQTGRPLDAHAQMEMYFKAKTAAADRDFNKRFETLRNRVENREGEIMKLNEHKKQWIQGFRQYHVDRHEDLSKRYIDLQVELENLKKKNEKALAAAIEKAEGEGDQAATERVELLKLQHEKEEAVKKLHSDAEQLQTKSDALEKVIGELKVEEEGLRMKIQQAEEHDQNA